MRQGKLSAPDFRKKKKKKKRDSAVRGRNNFTAYSMEKLRQGGKRGVDGLGSEGEVELHR